LKTTGVFTTHRFEIPVTKINEPIYFIPFGDIHRSSPLCSEEKWLEFLAWAKSKKRAFFLGMGDYDDLASTSEREILKNPKLHEGTINTLEGIYRKFTDRLAGELSFMKGRLVGLSEGNHYGEFQNGTTTTQRLCEKLGCKYLGVSSFIRLAFKYGNKKSKIDVWAHHGLGAARLIGGSLNKVQQMAEAADAEIYLMGHDHKKSIGMTTKLVLQDGGGGLSVRHRKILLARTGSFLKAYEDGAVSYIADKAGNPTDLGTVKIELTPKRDQDYMGEI